MLPALAAIGMVFSAINAASAVKSMFSDSSKAAAAAGTDTATSTNKSAASAAGAASATNAASATTAATGATGAGEIQDRFLKLLVTQLKNQDPLNPMDNAQLTTQLAQINTVSGIQQLNTTMQSLSTSLLSSQSTQSAALIGRTVLAEGNKLNIAGGKPATGGMQLPEAVERVQVSILGPAGNIVRHFELGPQKAGLSGFEWDGLNDAGAKVADGSYEFQVTATNSTGKVDVTPVVAGAVTSITLGGGATRLTVDGVGEVAMAQIKNIM